MKLADMNYFFTQKLSWNNVNKFPLTTFWWIGLDGSKTLTHMAPSETYNAQCTPEELVRSVKNHRDKVYSNSSLLVYGNGDGGGGPLSSMIERLRRMKDVDGLPKTRMALPTEFYENIEKTSEELPSWKGELVSTYNKYMEYFNNVSSSTSNYIEVFTLHIPYAKNSTEVVKCYCMISNY